jgi:hypothetical protein
MKTWFLLFTPIGMLGLVFLVDLDKAFVIFISAVAGGLSGFYLGLSFALERMYYHEHGEYPASIMVDKAIEKLLGK